MMLTLLAKKVLILMTLTEGRLGYLMTENDQYNVLIMKKTFLKNPYLKIYIKLNVSIHTNYQESFYYKMC